MNSVIIIIILAIISFIIGVLFGYWHGHRDIKLPVDGYFLIDKSPNLENERWTWFFDIPLDEVDNNRTYVLMRVDHKE